MNEMQWFKEAKFGMMIHFGVYSVFNGEYNGEPVNEWARFQQKIPYNEYHEIAKTFNPTKFDAEEWVRVAKAAGCKYIVVTTKHHDGFALFDSKVSDFNIVKATPFGRDIIKELSVACANQGIKLGLYYSHDMDWDEPGGGGFLDHGYWYQTYPGNNFFDFGTPTDEEFNDYLENKAIPQIRELLTNYGPIVQMWFDNPWTISPEQSKRIYDVVKEVQPNCLVNERCGNGYFDIIVGGDNQLDKVNEGSKPCEVPATINKKGDWSYRKNDYYMSAQEIYDIKKELNDKGINLLLNIGPKPDGTLPAEAVKSMEEVGRLS